MKSVPPADAARLSPANTVAVERSFSYTVAAAVLFALGVVVRIWSLIASRNTGGDALARVTLTANWLQHPDFRAVFDGYPPGHFWLIGALTLAIHNVALAARLLSLLLGIGSLFLVWKISRLLYGELAGLFSLAVVAIYTMHISYSGTSSSEISYLFFLLASIFLFLSYVRSDSTPLWYLAVSGLSISMSASIRFEAWVFFAGMFLLLCYTSLSSKRGIGLWRWLQPFLVFGITGGIWPVFMMIYCYKNFGDPMYLVTWNRLRVQQTLADIPSSLAYQLSLQPVALLISLSALALLAAIYGWAKSFTSPLPRLMATLVLFFLLIQTYQIYRGSTLALARYTLTMGTMLTIFAGNGLQLLCQKFAPHRSRLALTLFVIYLGANALGVLAMSDTRNRFADKFASVSPQLRYPSRIEGVGKFLRAHIHADDLVVLDDYNRESNVLADASGLPLTPGDRWYRSNFRDPAGVRQYIDTKHPRFLVYSDVGTLRSTLTLPSSCAQDADLDGVEFHCEYSNSTYRVYELNYKNQVTP